MPFPRIGDKPMTNTERSARKRVMDKERIARLEAENAYLRERVAALSTQITQTVTFIRKQEPNL